MATKWNQQQQGAKRRRTNQNAASSKPATTYYSKKTKEQKKPVITQARDKALKTAVTYTRKKAAKTTPYQRQKNAQADVKNRQIGYSPMVKDYSKQQTKGLGNRNALKQVGGAYFAAQEPKNQYHKLKDRYVPLSPLEQAAADAQAGRKAWRSQIGQKPKTPTAEEAKKQAIQKTRNTVRQFSVHNQKLSGADSKLPKAQGRQIQDAKQRYDEAQRKGDKAGMARAHRDAELIRSLHGYSGGAAGDQKTSPKLSTTERNALNARGETALKQVRMQRQRAVTEEEIAKLDRREREILGAKGFREKSGADIDTTQGWSYDANGRRMWSGTKEQSRQDARQGVAALQATGEGALGGVAYAGQVASRANRDRFERANMEKWIRDAANYNAAKAELDYIQDYRKRHHGQDPEGRSLYAAQIAFNEARQAQAQLDRIRGDVDSLYFDPTVAERLGLPTTREETLGERLLRQAAEHQAEATQGMSGPEAFLTNAMISVGQSAPGMALGAVPVVGPALGMAVLGAQAGGARAYDLRQQGLTAEEAYRAGIISGGIEALTEKLPLENFARMIQGRSGKTALRNVLEQAGLEGSEEAVSYLGNYIADMAQQNPDAHFSMAELLENAGMGAVGGAVFGAAGSMLAPGHAVPPLGAQSGEIQDRARGAATQIEVAQNAEAQAKILEAQRLRDDSQAYNEMVKAGVWSDAEKKMVKAALEQRYAEIAGQSIGQASALNQAPLTPPFEAGMQRDQVRAERAPAPNVPAPLSVNENPVSINPVEKAQRVTADALRQKDEAIARRNTVAQLQAEAPPVSYERSGFPPSSIVGAAIDSFRENRARAEAEAQVRRDQEIARENRVTATADESSPAPAQRAPAARPVSRLEELASTFGESGAANLRTIGGKMVTGQGAFVRDFTDVYNQVLGGRSESQVSRPAGMSDANFFAAVTAAKNDRQTGWDLDILRASKAAGRNVNAGVDWRDQYVRQMDRKTARIVDGLAKALGVKVVFAEQGSVLTAGGTAANAEITGNVVWIEKNNPNPVRMLIGHELTHRMQDVSPESYRAFRDYVMSTPGAMEALERTVTLYQKAGAFRAGTNARQMAMDEVTADYAGALLENSEQLQEFIRRNYENRTMLEVIRDFFRDLAAKLTGRQKAQADEAVRLLEEAIKGASARVKSGTTTGEDVGDGTSRHSISSVFSAAGLNVEMRDGRIVATDQNGKGVKKVTYQMVNDSGIGAMINYAADPANHNGRAVISTDEAKIQIQAATDLLNMMLKAQDGDLVWRFAGSAMFSAVKSNSDGQYGTTIDFSTVCRKTQEMMTAMSKAMVDLGRGLTKEEVIELQSDVLSEHGTVPCPVCYVFSRWAGVGGILDNMAKFQRKYGHEYDDPAKLDARIAELRKATKKKADLRAMLKEHDTNYMELTRRREEIETDTKAKKKERTALNRKKPSGYEEMVDEINTAIKANDSELARVKEDIKKMEDEGAPELAWLEQVRKADDYWQSGHVKEEVLFNMDDAATFAAQYPLAWRYRTTRGPSAGKAILPYSDMRQGDLILGAKNNSAKGNETFRTVENGTFNQDQLKAIDKAKARTLAQNLIGGQRFQSTSDFRYDYGLDYLQVFWEAQALGSKMQTYTKIIEFAEMVASLNGDVNVSMMPLNSGLDENGNLLYSSVTGMDIEAAKKANDMYDSLQLILVGINDEHILTALDDFSGHGGEYVGFVIPYHASGASINRFIRGLVENLNETFNEEYYKDYSNVQTDSVKKVPGAKEETVAEWMEAMRLDPKNPQFTGRKPNAAQRKALEQRLRSEIRKAILKHKVGSSSSDADALINQTKKFFKGKSVDISDRRFEDLRDVEQRALAGDKAAIKEYESWSAGALWDLYQKMWVNEKATDTYGVTLNTAQAGAVMPHEYWSKTVNREHAYVNGFIFRSYCYNLGLRPRFTGVDSAGREVGYGDFSVSRGYWKTLIDRAMYDNQGNYRDQQRINVTNLSNEMLTPEYGEQRWGDFKVQEPSQARAERAAAKFVERHQSEAEELSDVNVRYSLPGVDNVVAFPQNGRRSDAGMSEAMRDEEQGKKLEAEIREIEDRLEFAEFDDDLSETELRRMRNRLFKARADLEKINAKESGLAKKTSIDEILDSLDLYRRVDLESLANQVSQYAWDDLDELSDDDLRDALRDVLEERKGDLSPLEAQAAKYGFSVRPPERYSIGTEGFDQAGLMRENQKLKEKLDYWRGQVKKTDRARVEPKEVRKLARKLAGDYQTTMDTDEITRRMQEIYDGIGKDWSYDRAYEEAGKLARDMVEQASATADYLYNEYEPMRQFFKGTPLVVTPEMQRAIPDYNDWRKARMGRLRLQSGSRTNVDQVFQEISEQWPEFFDEMVTASSLDQLERIAEVMDEIYTREDYNPFGDDMAQPAGYLAADILESFYDVPSIRKTYADRAQDRLNREISKRNELREKYQEKLEKVREDRDRKLKKKSEEYLGRTRARSQRQKERELRAKIQRHVKKLSTKLTRPTDTQHIPEALIPTVRTALESINLASKDMKDTKRTQAFAALQKMYQDMEQNGSEVVLDPDLLPNISDIIGFADTPIANLGLDDLTTIWQTVRAIEASISTFNKALGKAKFETISQPAFGIRDYLTGRKDRGDYRGPFRPMDKLLNFNMLTPEAFFLRMGESGKQIFRMLRDAQDKHITIMDQAQRKTREITGKTDIKKLEKEKHTFTFGGEAVELTTAQIMSLYELMKRQQAVDHVMVGGVRPESVKKGIKDMPPARPWHLTQDQVSEIVDSLTEDQVKLADELQKYMGGTMAELGNEASMEVYGYRKFTEKNYFPISVDKNQTQSDVKNDAVSGTIAGWGSARPVKPNANNAVILRSIFDVYADHVTEMANYASWLAPMENMNRILNFRYKDDQGIQIGTMKDELEKLFGRNGSAYWRQLQDDLNNGVHGRDDSPFSTFMGTYKASAIGANIRVIAQQPTAILRALDSINPVDYVTGMARARIGKFDKTVKRYAPIAIWKDWGYFQQDTGRQMRNVLFDDDTKLQRANSAMMWGAGKADSLAWTAIWNALESETRRKRKDLRPNTQEFYRAVAERFNEVVDHTQVVDGILQRSQIMRSADGLTKMATSFMAEPTKTYNMLVSAIYEARNAKGKERSAAMGKLARTAFALTVSITLNAAAQALVDGIRDDDKDEGYWEKFIQAYFGLEGETRSEQIKNGILNGNLEAAFNPLTYIPYLKDIVSQTQGYSVSRMDMDTISRVLKAFSNVQRSMSGEGKMTAKSAWLNFVAEISRFLGIPVANIKRDIQTISRTFFAGTGNYRMLYEQEKFLYDVTSKSTLTEFSKLILSAERAGDEEAAQAIRQDMIDRGVDAEKLDKKLADLRKKAVTDTEEYQTAVTQKTDAYNTMLEASQPFQALTQEQQEKARSMVNDYAEWQAFGDQVQIGEKDQATMDKIQTAEAQQIDPALYATCTTAFADMHNDKDADGNDIEGQHQQDKVIRYIQAIPDLTNAQRSALYHLKYDSDKNNPWA